MKRIILSLLIAGLVIIFSASAASAAGDAPRSYGIRAGYGHNPDQFVIGAQADMGDIYSRIHFFPSIDAGFGDHVTTIGFNGDFKVFLPLPESSVSLYGLAGPTIEYWSWDAGGSDTEIGLYLGGGVRMALGGAGWYNLEVRAGIGDVPDLRILIGVLFGGR
jgi:hypothetical protein